MEIKYLNLISYKKALEVMENCHSHVVENPTHPGYLLVLEHPPTVTMGKRELFEDMIIPPEQLKFKGVDYCKIDRGGSVTVHEPGQLVVYPILNINTFGLTVRKFVDALEQSMIDTCAQFGVRAARDEINPGVWVGENKIGALGIRIQEKVTKHGIAFNVTNNLETFSHIIPCGIRSRGVTTLLREIEKTHTHFSNQNLFKDVQEVLVDKLIQAFRG